MSHIWRISYHGGEMFALVEAAMPDEAVEIAKAHRLAKHRYRKNLGPPSKAVLNDIYEATAASDRNISWCRQIGVGIQTGMPPKKAIKGGTLSGMGLRAIRLPEDLERADATFVQAA